MRKCNERYLILPWQTWRYLQTRESVFVRSTMSAVTAEDGVEPKGSGKPILSYKEVMTSSSRAGWRL